ncbi:PssD/Cps14F family polysaccharide biosynthesis glycosyltransferase [Anaerophaga thermohalophila]|uniref:PssD/Cps14F family polysaccharide biosynthesis glycosyltransferase n=1 Tax=Anaerophaga thermohalophila TaxID=177400 RepID=UPI000369C25E|nr:PssD/Cps14F family polysaccharide biosynthesis glycosyltransferase [Anaerophaga thermohalophila]
MSNRKRKVLFVSSAGGHLEQLLQFEPLFSKYEYLIATEKVAYNLDLKEKFNVAFLKKREGGRGIRFWLDFFRNSIEAFFLIMKFRPDIVISTGSYIAIPFFFFGKIFQARTIFLLSYARVKSHAKSADIAYFFSDVFIVQWDSAKDLYKKAIYLGGGIY